MKPINENRLKIFCRSEAHGPFSYITNRGIRKSIFRWGFDTNGDFQLLRKSIQDGFNTAILMEQSECFENGFKLLRIIFNNSSALERSNMIKDLEEINARYNRYELH